MIAFLISLISSWISGRWMLCCPAMTSYWNIDSPWSSFVFSINVFFLWLVKSRPVHFYFILKAKVPQPSMQWAAVKTHSSEIIVPPQKCEIPPRKFLSDTLKKAQIVTKPNHVFSNLPWCIFDPSFFTTNNSPLL